MVLGMGRRGLLAAVNSVAQFAELVEADGRDFVVIGPRSFYFDPEKQGNPWLYYFEPVFPGARLGRNPPRVIDHYKDAIAKVDHALAPRMLWGIRQGLELPRDRHRGHRLLARYIRLNSTARNAVDSFANTHFNAPVVGLHIRGPGGTHGGALELRKMLDPTSPIPFEHYFRATDTALDRHPDAALLACSDSQMVIDRVRERYGARVLTYNASRSDFGEMHENHPANEGLRFSPFRLGMDVVTEAHLLAKCVHFVHGISNIANYVLCRAPDMPNTYVYSEVEPILRARIMAEHGNSTAPRDPMKK